MAYVQETKDRDLGLSLNFENLETILLNSTILSLKNVTIRSLADIYIPKIYKVLVKPAH